MERSEAGRQWFRLYLGRTLMADNLWSEADLLRELERHGLTVADFQPDADDQN